MDILSDVKIVGNLNVSELIRGRTLYGNYVNSTTFSTSDGLFYAGFNSVNIKNLVFEANNHYYVDHESFSEDCRFIGYVKVFKIPAQCSKFVVDEADIDVDTSYWDEEAQICGWIELTNDNVNDFLMYPTISAYKGNKMVDIDIELCSFNMSPVKPHNRFTEMIFGEITPQNEDFNLKVSIKPNFWRFDAANYAKNGVV